MYIQEYNQTGCIIECSLSCLYNRLDKSCAWPFCISLQSQEEIWILSLGKIGFWNNFLVFFKASYIAECGMQLVLLRIRHSDTSMHAQTDIYAMVCQIYMV